MLGSAVRQTWVLPSSQAHQNTSCLSRESFSTYILERINSANDTLTTYKKKFEPDLELTGWQLVRPLKMVEPQFISSGKSWATTSMPADEGRVAIQLASYHQ